MPIYEFVCQECGNEFERIRSWSDSSTPVCTVCAASNVVRRISPPAIHFKGSGWYVTDSKKGNKNGAIDHGSNGSNGSNGDNGNNGDGETKKAEVKERGDKGGGLCVRLRREVGVGGQSGRQEQVQGRSLAARCRRKRAAPR